MTLLIGLIAGLASGLLGVGGGIVMVPLLTSMLGMTQHSAHATSLAAIIPIASSGALTFAAANEVDYGIAILLGAGTLLGAPLGARSMAHSKEWHLKLMFGILMIVVGGQILFS